jgi:hypothetical protein
MNQGLEGRGGRRSQENHYCAGCRQTRTFQDRGITLHCPVCARTLHRAF